MEDNTFNLASKTVVRGIMEKHGLYAKKNYGQNFLTDAHVLSKIVNAAEVCEDDLVIEVGPGLGVLTAALASKAKKVIAIEIDPNLIPILNENLAGYRNIEIINQDILKTDIAAIIEKEKDGGYKAVKVAANLPYYITTPIIFSILESHVPVSIMAVMVQKEVGERMRAAPSTKAYGSLTLAIGYYADVTLAANVPSNCFFPRPDVGSAVMKLEILDRPRVAVANEQKLFEVIKAAFSMRRKTLLNCLSFAENLNVTKIEVAEAIKAAGLGEAVRGEALTIEDFARLTELLCAKQ